MASARGVAGGVRWSASEPAPGLWPELAVVVRDADAGRLADRKRSRRKSLHRVDLAGRGPHLLKVNRYRGLEAWLRRLRGSKAARELRLASAVAARGIPTPPPLAAGERVAGGRLAACYLLVPLLEDVADLLELGRQGGLCEAERRGLAEALGELVRRVHDAGVHQGDLSPNNFLARRGPPGVPPELFFIDFERVRLRPRPLQRSVRLGALAKLERRMEFARARDRWRFLLAYAGSRREARAWWYWLEAYVPRLARSDLVRLRRSTTREGRRQLPVEQEGIRGWAHRDAPLPDLLVAVTGGGRVAAWRTDAVGTPGGHGRSLWAQAHLLWMRSLAPRPLALLGRADRLALFSERDASDLRPDARREREGAPVERLLRRLLALGELDSGLVPSDVVLRPRPDGSLQALLVSPMRLRIGSAPAPNSRRARARRSAAKLLAVSGA